MTLNRTKLTGIMPASGLDPIWILEGPTKAKVATAPILLCSALPGSAEIGGGAAGTAKQRDSLYGMGADG